MAASLRRERRKRILENREARLRMILGEKAEEDEVSVEPVLDATSPKDVPKTADYPERLEDEVNDFSHLSSNVHARIVRQRKFVLEEAEENALGNSKETVPKKLHSSSSLKVSNSSTKTKESNTGTDRTSVGLDQTSTRENMNDFIRIVANLVLAMVLVIYAKRSRLEWWGPASRNSKEDTTKTQVAYQSMVCFTVRAAIYWWT